jgi:hypothetical protein
MYFIGHLAMLGTMNVHNKRLIVIVETTNLE